MNDPMMTELFRAMPKAELHAHLDGAVEVRTAMALLAAEPAARRGAFEPDALPDAGLLSYEKAHRRLVIGDALATQDDLLAYYDLPLALLQSEAALCRVAEEMLTAKAADNVRYCEVRWAPRLHTRGGLTVRQVVASVLEGKKRACRRTGIHARLIVTGMKFEPWEANADMLRQVADMGVSDEVTAADLAGHEKADPDPTVQAAFFAEAKRLGFCVTLHCGELPGLAPTLRRVIDEIAPARVAHGVCAAADPDLCALLARRGIQLDLCPTSNLQAGLWRDYADYPLRALFDRDVPVSVSTDSPVLSGVTLSEEYARVARAGLLTPAELWRVNLASLDRIFAPDALKAELKAEFSAWANGIAELTA